MTISRALARPLSRPLKRNLYSSTSNLTPAFSLFSGATLSPLVTFTRASSATYIDSAGVMQTAATNTPRIEYDPVSLAFKGLLVEEARTNLVTYSAEFDNAAWPKGQAVVNADAATSPDGTTTADRLIDDGGAGSSQVYAGFSLAVSTSTTYTLSFFAKADQLSWVVFQSVSFTTPGNVFSYFNLASGVVGTAGTGHTIAIEDYGDGWYRCFVTFTTDAADTVGTLRIGLSDADGDPLVDRDGTSSIFLWGTQFELGAFATSYIPTVAATATRAADVASVTGASFSGFYNQSEGAFVAEAEPINALSSDIFNVSDGSVNNRVISRAQNAIHLFSVVGGVNVANIDAGTFTAGSFSKIAVAVKLNDYAATIDGGSVATDLSAAVPTVDRFYVGSGFNGASNYLNGHIKSLDYYSTRLPDATLVELTT